ncbi:glycosyltransferase [Brevundimonas nasdae]|uniref:Glycosyltransferase n=1 Tax=Brevundimonas nasdae TaxID=172043 RepID=A0ACD4VLN5_9CAUL|nr:glycosyltransferase [Brevundimonas nasdae]WOB78892.1 glycosyltransferase [Brevundimonas nasdae]
MSATALLVVERDFLDTHVGVRRVVLYYWQMLERQGFRVSLAHLKDGRLYGAKWLSVSDVIAAEANARNDRPVWTSTTRDYREVPTTLRRSPSQTLVWQDREVRLDDYNVTVVTNPWLCAGGMPDGPITAGIVYDMVPNLLAVGALNMGAIIDVYEFARKHDQGYQLYLNRAEKILSISESAGTDFKKFYRLEGRLAGKVSTVVPFEISDVERVRSERSAVEGQKSRILLVNILDARKNFSGVKSALKIAALSKTFDVDVVGKERMPLSGVIDFLGSLADMGGEVSWYRDCSNAALHRLYVEADLLVFPSYYEGLGLPILEAQSHGVPVVTSDTSSCVEVNLNRDLAVDPYRPDLMAQAISTGVSDASSIMRSHELRNALADWLTGRNTFDFSVATARI